jgi:hypothetical protein
MTRKVYKSAMGKPVDLGALLLQNEQVRAVGNMGVNAAGDILDSNNLVIDQRTRQVQRQYKRQSNVSNTPPTTSNISARKTTISKEQELSLEQFDTSMTQTVSPVKEPDPVTDPVTEPAPPAGGLAAAIARSREVKQELEKSLPQRQQEQGIKKI